MTELKNEKTNSKSKISELKPLIRKFRYFFAVLLLVVVGFGGYILFVSDQFWSYRENSDLLKKMDISILSLQAQLQRKQDNSVNIYRLTADEKRIINMVLPEEPNHSSVVEHLTAMAQRSGFLVSSLSLSELPSSVSTEAGKINVRLQLVKGDYRVLKNLIDLIENSVMPIDVLSINFSQDSLEYALVLNVYYK
jgi:hypothetical protein